MQFKRSKTVKRRKTVKHTPKPLEESVRDAIASIREGHYGGTYLKIELEGHLDRGGGDGQCGDCDGEGSWSCDYCLDGSVDCGTCNGSGQVGTGDDRLDCNTCAGTGSITCRDCYGEGRVDCNNCDGRGNWGGQDWGGNGECQAFIESHVSEACREATVYGRFGFDGSVDSEYMATLPLSWEGLNYAIEYINAFKLLADEIGNGLDVGGAGMHLTILTSERGDYPSNQRAWHRTCKRNFERNMTKLLPALMLLASENHKSRGIGFRYPRIGQGNHSSAIDVASHGGSSVYEWRVFETCYQRPEMLYDFICVMAKGLEFYAPKVKDVDLGVALGSLEYKSGQGVHAYFRTEKHLVALKAGLKYLLPDHRTEGEAYRLRNFTVTPEALKRKMSRIQDRLEDDYSDYRKRIKAEKKRWCERQTHHIHWEISHQMRRNMTEAEIDREIAQLWSITLRNGQHRPTHSRKAYLEDKAKEAMYGGRPDYVLEIN